MKTAKASAIALASLLLVCAGCTGETDDAEAIQEGFTLLRADAGRGVSATYRSNEIALRFESHVVGDQVHATVRTEDNRVVTRLTVPLGIDLDVGVNLGPLARASADAQMKRGSTIAPGQLVPLYLDALQQLHAATRSMGRSTVRFAVFWQYEVLIRMLPPDPNANTSYDQQWDDSLYSLDGKGEFVHTNLIYAGNVRRFEAEPSDSGAVKCDLGCAWYDVCCHHDEACVDCAHWWCSPWCVPGCFGGDCGGGR